MSGRNRSIIAGLVAACLAAGAAQAESPVLAEARKALAEKIPQVAVHKLRTLLAAPKLDAADRAAAQVLLAEALLDAGRAEDALEQMQKVEPAPANAFLRANIHAALGQWEEALPLYQEAGGVVGAASTKDVLPARIGAAEALHALGRTAEAATVLEALVQQGAGGIAMRLRLASLVTELGKLKRAQELLSSVETTDPTEQLWKRYVEARILLAQGHADTARRTFIQVLQEAERLPDSLRFGATMGLAEALITLKGYDRAGRELETFIWRNPQSGYLEAAFQRLDQIYEAQDDPQEGQLHGWAQKMEPGERRRAALALFYVGRLQLREKKYEKAALSLGNFVRVYRSNPLLGEAYLMQADLALALNQLPQAVTALEAAMRQAQDEEQRAETELRTGLVLFQQGEYLLAANHFSSAAEHSERLRSVATFNCALAWLNQGNETRFQEQLRALGNAPREQRLRSDLLLEQGLLQAREGELRAEENLQLFLHNYPRHAREAEARLALAELAYWRLQASAVPPLHGAEQAVEYLRVANAAPQTAETQEQAEYLAIFLADAREPGNDEEIIKLARQFLRDRGESALVAEVQMKLGQVYYRKEDFANAETQFLRLVENTPRHPYTESALFLAGQSAMKLRAVDRAFDHFDRVVEKKGPLELYARQEQAAAFSRLDKEAEAIRLYDLILAAPSIPDPELRAAALCGKADNLARLGRKDADRLEEAIRVYEQLAGTEGVSVSWRNQALYKKAKVLEQLGRTSEAITAYYDVLEKSAAAPAREYFWSYKAGFDAAKLFEQQEQWRSAIGVYEKLAQLGGPRTEEVQDRIKHLRLKQFIFD